MMLHVSTVKVNSMFHVEASFEDPSATLCRDVLRSLQKEALDAHCQAISPRPACSTSSASQGLRP